MKPDSSCLHMHVVTFGPGRDERRLKRASSRFLENT